MSNQADGSRRSVPKVAVQRMEVMKTQTAMDDAENRAKMSFLGRFTSFVDDFLFPGLPSHYPLRKKILIARSTTPTGANWDVLMIVLPLLICCMYVTTTYIKNLQVVQAFYIVDVIITQLFLIDFLILWYTSYSWQFWIDFVTLIDILSILPVYVSLIYPDNYATLSFFQTLRVLRLVRIFKSFKWLRNLSGVRRQVLNLTVTLCCTIFLAAGLVQIIENIYNTGDCGYINEATNWEPSCSGTAPAAYDCDCEYYSCSSYYRYLDTENKPSGIQCLKLTFFDSFYYIVVTVSTVGYGDIYPTSNLSKFLIIVFVVACIILIPISVSKLQKLLSLKSPFRRPYTPHGNESHIIVGGYVSDARKLERFFSEFFHPDRVLEEEYHAVILAPSEPSEDVRLLLQGQILVSRVTYVIGTATATEDLKRARADSARCMFFLCNTEVSAGVETNEDAATILRALSVSNFNPNLECLVQVLKPEERVILKDSDVDCILCLDEFKTVLQARNAVCPGFSTFIENIFHSVEGLGDELKKDIAPWYEEYLHGAGMELYFIPLNTQFLRTMQFNFSLISEALFLEFGTITLGTCNELKDSIVFNPKIEDLTNYANMKDFFRTYNTALIMADDQHQADEITKAITDPARMRSVNLKLQQEEELYSCKNVNHKEKRRRQKEMRKNGDRPNGFEQPEHDDDDNDDDDSDSDSDDENYIGYSSYDAVQEQKSKQNLLKSDDRMNSQGEVIEDQTISGPSLKHIPSFKDGNNRSPRKTRLVPSIIRKKMSSSSLVRSNLETDPFSIGRPSRVLEDASNLRNHIVVFGCDYYLTMFVSELRRPAVKGDSYHPIVVIGDIYPDSWNSIQSQYNDVFFIKASMSRTAIASKANLEHAFALIFLATRDSITKIDDESVDAVTLFAFLKLELLIPRSVFCSIELNSSGNMAVLNATIMKRVRRAYVEKTIAKVQQKKLSLNGTLQKQQANNKLPIRRGSVLKGRSSFSTQGKASIKIERAVDEGVIVQRDETEHKSEKLLWEAVDAHYIFPVFASARVFVPSTFETLLVQSFYVKLTPVICERFVCGQLKQTVQQVAVPPDLVGKRFLDAFRLFMTSQVICLGLYRAPNKSLKNLLPYVYISPPPQTILNDKDKFFVFASSKNISIAIEKAQYIHSKPVFFGL